MTNANAQQTVLKSITPAVIAMLTGYVTVSDSFLSPLSGTLERLPTSTAWLMDASQVVMYMA